MFATSDGDAGPALPVSFPSALGDASTQVRFKLPGFFEGHVLTAPDAPDEPAVGRECSPRDRAVRKARKLVQLIDQSDKVAAELGIERGEFAPGHVAERLEVMPGAFPSDDAIRRGSGENGESVRHSQAPNAFPVHFYSVCEDGPPAESEESGTEMPDGKVSSDVTRLRIIERMDALKLTPNFVADKGGLNRSTLRASLDKEGWEPHERTLRAIAPILQTSVAYLRGHSDNPSPSPEEGIVRSSSQAQFSPAAAAKSGGSPEDTPTLKTVPIVGEVEAGAFRPVDWFEGADLGEIAVVVEPRFERCRNDSFSAYKVVGDSMENAGICDGDAVICLDPWAENIAIETGNWVVVQRTEGHTREVTVKEYVVNDDGSLELRPHSNNPKHQPMHFAAPSPDMDETTEIRVIGVVIHVQKKAPPVKFATPIARRLAGLIGAIGIAE